MSTKVGMNQVAPVAAGDHILVTRARRPMRTRGGIALPTNERIRKDPEPCYGTVVSVGPEVKNDELQPGVVVLFNEQESEYISAGNIGWTVLSEMCVYALYPNQKVAQKAGLSFD